MKTWDIDDKVDAVYEMRMQQVNDAIRTGGPASGGLTVRDYFATQILAGMIHNWDPDYAVSQAYKYADALMVERNKKPQTPCSVEEAFGL